jgi:hypothetical protein
MRREPDIKGPAAEVWECSGKAQDAAQTATLVVYLVKMSGAHPFWDHWIVTVVHLRDIDGAPPANLQYPEAEYELLIVALNPEASPENIDPDDLPAPLPWLSPIDAAIQFDCGGMDQAAIKIARLAIESMTRGEASPDTDYRGHWEAVIKKTAQHYREGRHGVG